MKISLVKQSTDWKDRAAGWHTYKVTSVCCNCGKETVDVVTGNINEIRAAYASLMFCEACTEKIDRARVR